MENEYKIELLAKIGEMFLRYGIKSVNMDDIAKHLSISKKTLYKYFKDKNDIVTQVVKGMSTNEECVIGGICDESQNAIDEIIRISEFVNQTLQNLNPATMFDLNKYYPEASLIFKEHKNNFVLNGIKSNIERGISEGYYRDNINPEIVARIYISKMDVIWDNDVFPQNKYAFAEVHLEMIRYHIRGIASPKGIKYLTKVISNNLPNV